MINDKKLLEVLLKNEFNAFLEKAFYEVTGETNFHHSWNLDVIADKLEQVRQGKVKRLIINVPPRSLKSVQVTVAFSAWMLGHEPNKKIITASYSGDLSDKFARDTKRLMSSEWYTKLFPKSKISKDRSSAADFDTISKGGRMSTSVEGTLTGRGGDIIIIDDPHKPNETSEDNLAKVTEWYQNTLLSRLNDKENGAIILIMQRLHDSDLSGYLLDSSDAWEHVRIPSIAEEDEKWFDAEGTLIHSRKEGEVINPSQMSMSTLETFKKEFGAYVFSGQYQQDPAPKGDSILKPQWFKFYSKSELPHFRHILQSWDTANKKGINNAYSACVIIGIDEFDNRYILEVFRDRLEFYDLVKKVNELYDRYVSEYNCNVAVLIEDQASGTQLIQTLKRDSYIYPEVIRPDSDKISRFKGASVRFERGEVYLPATKQGWWTDFENEILRFPASRYADQVDALSQALNYEYIECIVA